MSNGVSPICRICGAPFVPSRKNHYIIKVVEKPFCSPFVKGADRDDQERKPIEHLYDCYDCPQCGGQACTALRLGFDYIDDIGVLETFVNPEDLERELVKKNPSQNSLYFHSKQEAEEFLTSLQRLLENAGFVSYWDYKARAGRPPRWEKEYGWDNLDSAMVCEDSGNRGFYIVMPSMKRKVEQ